MLRYVFKIKEEEMGNKIATWNMSAIFTGEIRFNLFSSFWGFSKLSRVSGKSYWTWYLFTLTCRVDTLQHCADTGQQSRRAQHNGMAIKRNGKTCKIKFIYNNFNALMVYRLGAIAHFWSHLVLVKFQAHIFYNANNLGYLKKYIKTEFARKLRKW